MWGRVEVDSLTIANLQLKDLVQHSKTTLHIDAVLATEQDNSEILPGAPRASEFTRAVRDRWKFLSWRWSDGTYDLRAARLLWLAAEATFDRDRAFFGSEGCNCAWYQDGRQRVFLVKYRGCNNALKHRSGVLGLKTDVNGAFNIRRAMETVCKDVSSPRLGATLVKSNAMLVEPEYDENMYQTLTSNIKLFAADGAADEQKAGRLAKELFTQLKSVLKDKHTQASVLSRHHGNSLSQFETLLTISQSALEEDSACFRPPHVLRAMCSEFGMHF